MTRLAEVLAIDVTRSRVEELAEHATMDAMRTQADVLSPELWPSPEPFFRGGGVREWRDIFTETEHEHYRQRSQELVAPEVLAWAHHGRQAADPDQ